MFFYAYRTFTDIKLLYIHIIYLNFMNRVVGGKNHSSFVSALFELPYILLITSFKKVLQCQEDVALLQTRLIIKIHNGMR